MSKTIIHKDDKTYFGDVEHLVASQSKSFSEMIFELLSGNSPKANELKLFEIILNLSIDHGPDTPSAVETIKLAREGKTISESVSSGILQINNIHGGAIEPAMELFYKVKRQRMKVKSYIEEQLREGKRIAGFGHRIYEVDPRAQLIFKLAKDNNISQEYIDIAIEIEKELKQAKGKTLPVNIDGAIAAILCAFGWPKELGKAVFIIARTPGLCGQFLNNS